MNIEKEHEFLEQLFKLSKKIYERIVLEPSRNTFTFLKTDITPDYNSQLVLEYLIKKQLIQVKQVERYVNAKEYEQETGAPPGFHNPVYSILIPEISIKRNEFIEYYRKLKKQLLKIDKNIEGHKTLISYGNDGNYYFNGKILKPKSTNSIYFKIFEYLYENSHLADGFCSYKDIDLYLQNNGKKTITNEKKYIKRILNGKNDFIRFCEDFKNKAPNRQDIIKVDKGKGLIFYNPLM